MKLRLLAEPVPQTAPPRRILGLERTTFYWVAAAVALLVLGIALDAFVGF